jgi:hypothetical protein
MATLNIIAQLGTSNVTASLNSTKVKVISNVACYYAVGNNSPVAYTTGNCAQIPANVFRDIIVGPANLVIDGNTSTLISSVGPKIAFIPVPGTGTALVTITEIGSVDFTKVPA